MLNQGIIYKSGDLLSQLVKSLHVLDLKKNTVGQFIILVILWSLKTPCMISIATEAGGGAFPDSVLPETSLGWAFLTVGFESTFSSCVTSGKLTWYTFNM